MSDEIDDDEGVEVKKPNYEMRVRMSHSFIQEFNEGCYPGMDPSTALEVSREYMENDMDPDETLAELLEAIRDTQTDGVEVNALQTISENAEHLRRWLGNGGYVPRVGREHLIALMRGLELHDSVGRGGADNG